MADSWVQEAYQLQTRYNDVFAGWKLFDRQHTEYIKSMIGLTLFGIEEGAHNESDTISYYQVYNAEKQEIIQNIYKHVVQVCGCNDIHLSCTYLVGKCTDGGIFEFPVLRYTRPLSTQIYFAERSGRYYKNWTDLVSCIPLPPCAFIAPPDGVYKSSLPVYKHFQSSAATISGRAQTIANKVAVAGSVACVAGAFCATAPVALAGVGLGISVYGIGQSISTLFDRSSHGQSIAPNNRESILSYGNIVACGLAGATTTAISNLGRLEKMFGTGALTACRVLNASTLILDAGFLLFNVTDFIKNLRDGTVTSSDVVNLSLQVFFICGAVVQTRDMDRLLNQPRTKKLLTKTQKRNLQKRRAKARARGEELPAIGSTSQSGENMLRVGESDDMLSSLKKFAERAGPIGVQILRHAFPRQVIIIDMYCDIRDLVRATFVDRTMDLKAFFVRMFYHAQNLYSIIQEDLTRLRSILQQQIPDRAINGNDAIAQALGNELDRADQAIEELALIGQNEEQSTPTAETRTLGNELHDTQQEEDQSSSTVQMRLSMILEHVQEVCSRYRVEDTADTQVSFFHDVLVFTMTYVSENCIPPFERVLAKYSPHLGEENAKKMAARLGAKTENDFYPTDNWMEQLLKKSDTASREFFKGKKYRVMEYENNACFSPAKEIREQYLQLLSSIYYIASQQKEMGEVGILELNRTLKELSLLLEERLRYECRKISKDSRAIYQENIEIFGQVIAEEMMADIEMPTTESGVFQSALKLLNTHDIISRMTLNRNSASEPMQIVDSRPAEQWEEMSHEKIYIAAITSFYKKIDQHLGSTGRFESKSQMYDTVVKFFSEKFINELKLDASKLYEELISDEDQIGRKLLKSMFEAIGECAREKPNLFQIKAQFLLSEKNLENMIVEFSNRYPRAPTDFLPPRIFDADTSEYGFTTYKMICDQNGSNEYYKELVCLLFNVKINELDNRIVRDRRSVVVKSGMKVITFNFLNEENEALVILTDLDCENESTRGST